MNKKYISQDSKTRPIAVFDKKLMLGVDCNDWILDRISDLAKNNRVNTTYVLNEFLIDLSWKSSELEGNSYTLLDSKVLIEYGEGVDGALKEETQMVLNHKYAINYLFNIDNLFSPVKTWLKHIQNINELLLKEIDPNQYGGVLRRHGELDISHSSYINPVNQIV